MARTAARPISDVDICVGRSSLQRMALQQTPDSKDLREEASRATRLHGLTCPGQSCDRERYSRCKICIDTSWSDSVVPSLKSIENRLLWLSDRAED